MNSLASFTSSDDPRQKQLALSYAKVLQQVINLKVFLVTAPTSFMHGDVIRQFNLPNDDVVSCIYWNNVFYITGTDIVRCLNYRFEAIGRVVRNRKKFEEGIFSDLRNLKCDSDAILEEPKSDFLEFLYKNNCVRTQKKQKVFHWYSVSHDRLFLDALERDLKKEAVGKKASTEAIGEPTLSFNFDNSRSLAQQLADIIEGIPKPLAAIADAATSSHHLLSQQLGCEMEVPSPIPVARPIMPMAPIGQAFPDQRAVVHDIERHDTALARSHVSPVAVRPPVNPPQQPLQRLPTVPAPIRVATPGGSDPMMGGGLEYTTDPLFQNEQDITRTIKPEVESDFPLDYFYDLPEQDRHDDNVAAVPNGRLQEQCAANYLAENYKLAAAATSTPGNQTPQHHHQNSPFAAGRHQPSPPEIPVSSYSVDDVEYFSRNADPGSTASAPSLLAADNSSLDASEFKPVWMDHKGCLPALKVDTNRSKIAKRSIPSLHHKDRHYYPSSSVGGQRYLNI